MSFIVKKHFCVNCFFISGGRRPFVRCATARLASRRKTIPLFEAVR
jgi:hypothetical protein